MEPVISALKKLFLILSVILTTSCSHAGFTEVYDLPGGRWPVTEAVNFDFAAAENLSPAGIDIIVRHSRDFPSGTLPLEIKTIAPSQEYWADTVAMPLTDTGGKWLGKSFSNAYDIRYNYRSGVIFKEPGRYSIAIRQLTGEDTLRTVMAVGVRIRPEK